MNLIINAILVSVSLGIILGAILAIASKVFEVKEDVGFMMLFYCKV